MASRFPEGNLVQLKPRKGHDMTWSCDKHGEPIAFYCKEHGLPVCDRCAIKNHCQKPCELDDIEDVIFERRRKLDEKRPKIQELQKQIKALDSKIKTASASGDTHLQIIKNSIQGAYNDKMKSVEEKGNRMVRMINEEADEEIRLANEKREKRIKDCNTEREKERKNIKDKETKLLSDTKTISEIVSKKIKDLSNKNQHLINTITNVQSTISRINQHEESLVNEAPQVLASIDENISIHKDVSDCLDRIQSEVERVTFVEWEVGGEYYGKIDGYIGQWESFRSINIPSFVKYPLVRGLIGDDEICVQDGYNKDMYVTNISADQHAEKVMDGGRSTWIMSCSSVDRNIIVCGKGRKDYTGGRLDTHITLYDRQWKMIRDISIPRNGSDSSVYADVDRDGMILAAQYDQSNIYIINPAYDTINNTITMQGKKVRGEVQALSSGDVVVKTGDNEFTVISRSGEEKAFIHCHEWVVSECCVDKQTDTLYIVHWDGARTYAVDQMSRDGIIQAKKIMEYPRSDRSHWLSPCLITSSGNLVGCDGDTLFLHKKAFVL
ncbi:uncharacterized protein LOC121423594 [Lytechinus variegatus]|uniref:uncharacterized protein LOC121423594 n=1 Tax=Lytechinus variegatus TaxID=7654 RepID=UPI001BB2298A|nr:uncharacterized protein LOC121423594 [Lytechinus variegatus]